MSLKLIFHSILLIIVHFLDSGGTMTLTEQAKAIVSQLNIDENEL